MGIPTQNMNNNNNFHLMNSNNLNHQHNNPINFQNAVDPGNLQNNSGNFHFNNIPGMNQNAGAAGGGGGHFPHQIPFNQNNHILPQQNNGGRLNFF